MLPRTVRQIKREFDTPPAGVLMMEKHFTIPELAALWAVSDDFVTDLFIDEPGIIRSLGKRKRLLRIPKSIAERVYQKMLDSAAVSR